MKKRTKKLSLNRETLLNLDDLRSVAGAGLTDDTCPPTLTCTPTVCPGCGPFTDKCPIPSHDVCP